MFFFEIFKEVAWTGCPTDLAGSSHACVHAKATKRQAFSSFHSKGGKGDNVSREHA